MRTTSVRLSNATDQRLGWLQTELDQNASDVIRDAISLYYQLKQKNASGCVGRVLMGDSGERTELLIV